MSEHEMKSVTPDKKGLFKKSGPEGPRKKEIQEQASDYKSKHRMKRVTPDKNGLLRRIKPEGPEKN
jgi:hypothetical protein